jgi:hypothetical protein
MNLKAHWLCQVGSKRLADCQISAKGPVTDAPEEVTCKSCRRRLVREGRLPREAVPEARG